MECRNHMSCLSCAKRMIKDNEDKLAAARAAMFPGDPEPKDSKYPCGLGCQRSPMEHIGLVEKVTTLSKQ